MTNGVFGIIFAIHKPTGEKIKPNIDINIAALYLKIWFLKPIKAPILAANAIAQSAIGLACAMGRWRKNTRRGTERIPPPAPVSPINKPTNIPKKVINKTL
jgi:hypothetical protein